MTWETSRRERLSRVHVAQLVAAPQQIRQPAQQVVAFDDADLEALKTELPRDLEDLRPAGLRVEAAGVGDHPDPLLHQLRQRASDEVDEVGGVAGGRIPELLPHHDRERDFGEVVHAEIVDRPPLDEVERRVDTVSPEPLPIGDSNGFHWPAKANTRARDGSV